MVLIRVMLGSDLVSILFMITPGIDVEASFWIVPHLSLSGAPSLAVLPSLITGPDLGAWTDCWLSAEFLRVPIPWSGSIGYDFWNLWLRRSVFDFEQSLFCLLKDQTSKSST